MAFLNALGRVSRHGRWRWRHVFRAAALDGRLDLTDNGLVALGHASDVRVELFPRRPVLHERCPETPVLSASLSAGTLLVVDPGFVEALWPAGWSACIPPGLYDLRVTVTIADETAVILDEPVELV